MGEETKDVIEFVDVFAHEGPLSNPLLGQLDTRKNILQANPSHRRIFQELTKNAETESEQRSEGDASQPV